MNVKRSIRRNVIIGYSRFRRFANAQRYLPRWAVFSIDMFLCVVAFLLTAFLIMASPYEPFKTFTFIQKIGVILVLQVLSFGMFRTYAGIIRHSTFIDVYKIVLSVVMMFVAILAVNQVYFHFVRERIFLVAEVLLYSISSLILLVAFRIAVKETYHFLLHTASGKLKKQILILGSDDKSIAVAQSILIDTSSPYRPVAFLSTGKSARKHKIMGLPLLNCTGVLEEFLSKYKDKLNIDGLLIVANSLDTERKNEIVESAFEQGLEIYNVALPELWQGQEDIRINIAPLQIEDLLDRNVIETDIHLISQDLNNKVILVTGGAGSIGGELVRQIAEFGPKKLIVLDNAESPLHEVDLYLKNNFPELNYQIYLANINNKDRMEGIFSKFNFDVIYHAAAYKHVPMIERHPREGIRTNALGTRNLAELAVKYGCDRFVMISTDKAVNPSNVMGASKRAAEMYVQSLQKRPDVKTKFITTRFGNVLGSNGSVIPFFKKQIEKGGPVTVTHRDIIRYFMTIKEACQLVLQAGTMGKGGEIFVFDMGKPVRILDMAERMIKLCGLRPYVDIPIEITGLREGEKLYEELLIDGETTLPTFHPKIMVNKMVEHDCDAMMRALDELEEMINRGDEKNAIIQKLKDLVPEYLSQNSIYEVLDTTPRIPEEKVE